MEVFRYFENFAGADQKANGHRVWMSIWSTGYVFWLHLFVKMRTILSLFVLSLLHTSLGYIITVDSHSEECFFDPATSGSKLGEKLEIFHFRM